jgi:hypothetical protein
MLRLPLSMLPAAALVDFISSLRNLRLAPAHPADAPPGSFFDPAWSCAVRRALKKTVLSLKLHHPRSNQRGSLHRRVTQPRPGDGEFLFDEWFC